VQTRLPFELDQRAETGFITAHGGVPLLIEAFRTSGAAAVLDKRVVIKRRERGLRSSELTEGLFALWAAGGERCDDLVQLREDAALALLLGHGLPAPQTARDFLEAFEQAVPPLWQGERSRVPGEGERLQGLAAANRRLIAWLQERRPQATATIDLDATILDSQKRSAQATYDGRTGYQPVIALWAEQDVVLADEFRDGNSRPSGRRSPTRGAGGDRQPAGAGGGPRCPAVGARADRGARRQRRLELALGPAPPDPGEQGLLRWLEAAGHGYAISADMSRELAAAIRALPETAWRAEREDSDAVRHWAEVVYVPSDGVTSKHRPAPPRYLALRLRRSRAGCSPTAARSSTSRSSPTCPTPKVAVAST